MNDNAFPVLYILMRNDLASMNAGKAMAQASHASNAFVHRMFKADDKLKNPIWHLFDEWRNETLQGFGTVLVLAVNEMQMRFSVDAAKRYGMIAEIIHDPTYPILIDRELGAYLRKLGPNGFNDGYTVGDGDRYITIPMDTCAYVFADKNDPITGMILGGYKLHP